MDYMIVDDLVSGATQDIPAVIPRLIDAAVAAFDADRDTSRRYLLHASALLRTKRETNIESARGSESRGGLLGWQLNRVVDHIEAHLGDKITAAELAKLISVGMAKLFRAFKISVGVTPFQYIARRRIELACTLMRTTREPLCQIAVACGLCDQAHLCRVFQRMTGMTPSVWRRGASATRDSQTRAPVCRTHGSLRKLIEFGAENPRPFGLQVEMPVGG